MAIKDFHQTAATCVFTVRSVTLALSEVLLWRNSTYQHPQCIVTKCLLRSLWLMFSLLWTSVLTYSLKSKVSLSLSLRWSTSTLMHTHSEALIVCSRRKHTFMFVTDTLGWFWVCELAVCLTSPSIPSATCEWWSRLPMQHCWWIIEQWKVDVMESCACRIQRNHCLKELLRKQRS